MGVSEYQKVRRKRRNFAFFFRPYSWEHNVEITVVHSRHQSHFGTGGRRVGMVLNEHWAQEHISCALRLVFCTKETRMDVTQVWNLHKLSFSFLLWRERSFTVTWCVSPFSNCVHVIHKLSVDYSAAVFKHRTILDNVR